MKPKLDAGWFRPTELKKFHWFEQEDRSSHWYCAACMFWELSYSPAFIEPTEFKCERCLSILKGC